MKIIISPTKTQTITRSSYLEDKELLYPHKHAKLVKKLQSLSKKSCKAMFHVSDVLFEKAYFIIQNYEELPTFHAFEGFNGLVFKGLKKELYHEQEYQYIQENIFILDAFYGLLEPGTLIREYRLDFKMNLGINLYDYWDISKHFQDEVIVNLASSEFSKMLKDKKMVTIHFLQEENGLLKNKATYSKQSRGKLLNYMIQNKINNIEEILAFKEDGYQYNQSASDQENIIFSRLV